MLSDYGPQFIGGSRLGARHLQTMSQQIRELKNRRGSSGVWVSQTDGGETLSVVRDPRKIYFARLTGYDSTAKAYSWKEVQPSPTTAGNWTDVTSGWAGTNNAFETCSNADLKTGSSDGVVVELHHCLQVSGAMVWFFTAGGGGVPRVRVTAAAAGGGKYNGYVVSMPTATISATGNIADSDLGANGVACLIVNAAEAGQSTHDLTSGTVRQKTFLAVYLGMSGDATPVPVYHINGFDLPGCA